MRTPGQQAAPHKNSFSALLFRIGESQFAIPSGRIDEIIAVATTLRLPGQPDILEGFLNIQGQSLPVVAFRRLFGFPAAKLHAYTPIMILSAGRARIGLLVDGVDEVVTMNSMSLEALDEGNTLNGCASARYTGDGRTAILLDCDQLLLRQESQRLAELALQAQQRVGELEAARL